MRKYWLFGLLFFLELIPSKSYALSVSCTPLDFGSFLMEYGLSSAEDSGATRIGNNAYIGSKADCEITELISLVPVTVTVNNNSSLVVLSGNGQSFDAHIRLEEDSGIERGTRHEFNITAGQTTQTFKVDGSVPSGQSLSGGGSFSASGIVLDVEYF